MKNRASFSKSKKAILVITFSFLVLPMLLIYAQDKPMPPDSSPMDFLESAESPTITQEWVDRLDARDHFYQYFERIYNSYYLGKGKRDPSHFSDVAADLGLDPSAILFIDDSRNNVASAMAAGMQAILYVDRVSFIEALKVALGTKVI